MRKILYVILGIVLTILLIYTISNLYLAIIGRKTCAEGCSLAYISFSRWSLLFSIVIGGILGYLKSSNKLPNKILLTIIIFLSIIWIAITWYGLDYGYGKNLSY
ncbi:hypothetical protein NG55_13870 [Acinetobacter gyllenbergii]|nr:hypothetical protein NG55_13870 [Acinetobacter gyllenbergii]